MIKVLLCSGQGKSHFLHIVVPIKNVGYDVKILLGWIPNEKTKKIANFLGNLLGRKNLYQRLSIRNVKGLNSSEIISNPTPEFIFNFLILMNRLGLVSKIFAEVLGWKLLGFMNKKYVKNADIFHVRSGAGQGGLISEAKKNGLKVVVDHSIAHPKSIDLFLANEFKMQNLTNDITPQSEFWKLVLEDCDAADLLLVNSSFVKETFISAGFCSDKIAVVYLGVRDDFMSLKKIYSRGKKLKLLYTGSFCLRKGARILIETVNELSKMGLEFQLDVVGGIAMDSQDVLTSLIDKSTVVFHGSVLQDELKFFLSDSDIYIFPTFAEGCAQSVMEAMYAGMPVITTENSGVPILDRENGIIVPVGNYELLTKEIICLAQDETLRMKLGVNASNTIRNFYTWKHYSDNIKEVYSSL